MHIFHFMIVLRFLGILFNLDNQIYIFVPTFFALKFCTNVFYSNGKKFRVWTKKGTRRFFYFALQILTWSWFMYLDVTQCPTIEFVRIYYWIKQEWLCERLPSSIAFYAQASVKSVYKDLLVIQNPFSIPNLYKVTSSI